MITIIYRVSVEIPEDVWRRYGHTKEYERLILEAVWGSASSGSNTYSEIEEWAECTSKLTAELIEFKLNNVVSTLRVNAMEAEYYCEECGKEYSGKDLEEANCLPICECGSDLYEK